MDFITSIFTWVSTENYAEIAGIVALSVLVFDRLAKLTPSTKDDAILAWIYKIFAVLGWKVPELTRDKKGNIVVEE
jgi:hypothetical protein